jgi:gluconokinase
MNTPKSPIVAGLEVSTSAAKCILFSLTEGVIRAVSMPFPSEVAETISQDPKGMVDTALQVLKETVQGYTEQVAAIGLCGTWHSLLLLDGNRQPIERIQTWADVSAAPTVQKIREDPEKVHALYAKTGCMAHAMYPVFKWIDRSRTRPVPTKVFLSSQVEYLFESLTGEAWVSRNTASGTGFFNVRRLDWDDEILAYAGVDRSQLGQLTEMQGTAPLVEEIAERVGLPSGIPVTVGGADGALTQIGLGGSAHGVLSFSVGTSGAVRMTVKQPTLPEEPSLWCYYLNDGHWLTGAATHAGSNLLKVLDWLGKTTEQLEREVVKIAMTDAPIFLPFLYGERCPGWAEIRQGGFFEMRHEHSPAHLYAAAMEGILFNLYHCYSYLEADPDQALRATGGILNSPYWLQMAADLFGRDFVAGGYTHDSVVGAAVMALVGIGALESLNDFQPQFTQRIVARPEYHAIHEHRFERYLELYRKTGSESV